MTQTVQGEKILMASGSELGLIVRVGQRLAEKDIAVRLASFQAKNLFERPRGFLGEPRRLLTVIGVVHSLDSAPGVE
jgi:hypothetical protein